MRPPMPIVLIEIDQNSAVSFRQTDGVHVAFVDRRVDPILVLWPERNQIEEILTSLDGLPVVSSQSDDALRSAVATIRRVRAGFTVVKQGPKL